MFATDDSDSRSVSLVAGIDSSTQSSKIVICDEATGAVLRSGSALHPPGTEVDPHAWMTALETAISRAGGLDDVDAISVGAQQHGMVCLDERGDVVRPALLWNDTRSGTASAQLVDELGGPDLGGRAWADAIGSVPVASFTITKLRWLLANEPANAARTATVCLPHDWITWQLAGAPQGRARGDGALATDRSEASGTGYFSPTSGSYRLDLLRQAFGHTPDLPLLLGPAESAGRSLSGQVLGCGSGDNAGAALGVGATPGDVIISVGTSGTVFAVCDQPTNDPSGIIAGFADATGRFLPLVCTMNAARVLDSTATLLGVNLDALSAMALATAPGADGLVVVPYLEGERTPNRPFATGAIHGLRLSSWTPENLARAAFEGMLCGLAAGLDALLANGVRVDRVILIGGASRSEAVRQIAPGIFGRPVVVAEPAEHVAIGAARQAAWILRGTPAPPTWQTTASRTYESPSLDSVRARYREVADLTADIPGHSIDHKPARNRPGLGDVSNA
ncbi:MAG TPA: FGGY-family carbohydrate kinase [Acidimicrobiales bacterium]